jgi:hypothetical protein
MFQVTENRPHNISYPQVRQQWFSVGGSPLDFLVLPDRKSPAIRPCV